MKKINAKIIGIVLSSLIGATIIIVGIVAIIRNNAINKNNETNVIDNTTTNETEETNIIDNSIIENTVEETNSNDNESQSTPTTNNNKPSTQTPTAQEQKPSSNPSQNNNNNSNNNQTTTPSQPSTPPAQEQKPSDKTDNNTSSEQERQRKIAELKAQLTKIKQQIEQLDLDKLNAKLKNEDTTNIDNQIKDLKTQYNNIVKELEKYGIFQAKEI